MAVYELEPKYKVGPFRFGYKLGRKIEPNANGVSVDNKNWSEGKGSCIVAGKREPISWWDHSGSFVTPTGPNTVEFTTWADDDIYGYTQASLGELTGTEINRHPLVGKRLRYIPD